MSVFSRRTALKVLGAAASLAGVSSASDGDDSRDTVMADGGRFSDRFSVTLSVPKCDFALKRTEDEDGTVHWNLSGEVSADVKTVERE